MSPTVLSQSCHDAKRYVSKLSAKWSRVQGGLEAEIGGYRAEVLVCSFGTTTIVRLSTGEIEASSRARDIKAAKRLAFKLVRAMMEAK